MCVLESSDKASMAFIWPANMHVCCESSVAGTHNVNCAHVCVIAHRPGASRPHNSIAVKARVSWHRRRPCASKGSPVIDLALLCSRPSHTPVLSGVAACTARACTDSPSQCLARCRRCALVLGRVAHKPRMADALHCSTVRPLFHLQPPSNDTHLLLGCRQSRGRHAAAWPAMAWNGSVACALAGEPYLLPTGTQLMQPLDAPQQGLWMLQCAAYSAPE